jgi:hypothetical protein
MKKEVVIASAIAGLLSSLSAGDNPTINIDKISIDKAGKVLASKDIKKGLEVEQGKDKFLDNVNFYCPGKKGNRKKAPIQKDIEKEAPIHKDIEKAPIHKDIEKAPIHKNIEKEAPIQKHIDKQIVIPKR